MAPHTSTPTERTFNRWARTVLIITALFVILGSIATLYILKMPTDGWQLDYNDPSPPRLRNFAGDWPTPLRLDDRIIAVDGVAVGGGDAEAPVASSRWKTGQTVTYTILRDGQQQNVEVVLHAFDRAGIQRSLWFAMSITPTEWFWSVIAILVFFLRPRSTAAQLMLLAFVPHTATTKLFWSAVTISHNFAPAPIFYLNEWITYFWGYLFFPAIILIPLSFPQPIFPLTRWPRAVPALLFGIPIAISSLSMVFRQQALLVPIVLLLQAAMLLYALGAGFRNIRRLENNSAAHAQGMWVFFGFALCFPPLLTVYLMDLFGVLVLKEIGWIYDIFFVLVLPACLAVAITRYRLFDIDVILRRTLQYTLLTMLLALVYFGGVVVLQSIFSSFSGIQNNEQVEDTAVIFSTLAIAALFTPLRRRVQQFIDRRFFRSKYDSEQILANFAVNTRQEVGLEPLSAALLTAVEETMQPEAVHLWIKPGRKKD